MNISCVTFNTTNYFVRNYTMVIMISVIESKINYEDNINEHSMCNVQHYWIVCEKLYSDD